MPIYEYSCQSCSHFFEVIQKISDSPLMDCPNCGKTSLEKVISSTQFQLKGTGWYATDFKNAGSVKNESATATSPESKSSTENKSASKVPSSES